MESNVVLAPSFSISQAISSIIAIIFLISLITSGAMIIMGVIGLVISLINKSPNNRWISVFKKGALILVATIVLFVVANIVSTALGLGANSSFAGDTEILTPNGRVKISTLKVGDPVLSFDIKNRTSQVMSK